MLQILIPTYNRAGPLKRNLEDLTRQITAANMQRDISIIISDNASTDATPDVIRAWQAQSVVRAEIHRQRENVGLEKNAVFLLERSRTDFVMYLGDDDYLPHGYLERVKEILQSDTAVGCIIPGFTNIFPDGTSVTARTAPFAEKMFTAGFDSVLAVSGFGHQLSGVVLRRAGLAEEYLGHPQYRNIYLFIFFVGYCAQRGHAWYLPSYQVQVSQGNAKDWGYDDAGLVPEIIKNYQLLFRDSSWRAARAAHEFMVQQSWRLTMRGRGKAFWALMRSDMPPIMKAAVPLTYARIVLSGRMARLRSSLA